MKISFGIMCFGERYYTKGAEDKLRKITANGFVCHILTDRPENFKNKYPPSLIRVYHYLRTNGSYHDKMLLVKLALPECDTLILLDADCDIHDDTIFDDLVNHAYGRGISYVDILANHTGKLKTAKDIDMNSGEWREYHTLAKSLNYRFDEAELMWEYLLVFKREGFDTDTFFSTYERLQVAKEFCDLTYKKAVSGAGEGISIRIAANAAKTPIERDIVLYETIKHKISSVSRRFSR
jgi:hypothetical protein